MEGLGTRPEAPATIHLKFPYICGFHVVFHVSHNLNSSKGDYIGDYIGDYYRGY